MILRLAVGDIPVCVHSLDCRCELCVRAQIEASALPATPRPGDKSVSQPISVEELEAGGPQLVMIITANNAGTSA